MINLLAGLVGWWKLDNSDISGPTMFSDLSGNGNNGTGASGATYPARTSGNLYTHARQFVLANNSVITVANAASLQILGNLTISCWFNGIYPGGTTYGVFLGKGGWDIKSGYEAGMQNSSGELFIGTNNGGLFSGTGAWPQNTWCHLVFTVSGTTGTIYVNAASVASGTIPALVSGTTALSIGRRSTGDNNVSSIQGLLQDVRVYSRALGQAEINALYRYGRAASGYVMTY